MRFFDSIPAVPIDPIFGVTVDFNADPRAEKVNLGVGIYRNEHLKAVLMSAVAKAEERIDKLKLPRPYLPMLGDPEFLEGVERLVLGDVRPPKVLKGQTPGGTAALRVAADLLRHKANVKRLYLSEPTWENHHNVFSAAGLELHTYDHLADDSLDEALPGSAVLFQAACHNPTGNDPTPERWKAYSNAVEKRQLLPIFDSAYQGLGDGMDEDAAAMRSFAARHPEMMICYSCSKNFGLYAERVGAILVITSNGSLQSQMERVVRSLFGNPPCHGSQLVKEVLKDPSLSAEWSAELVGMRLRLKTMRARLLEALGPQYAPLNNQKGLFSFIGLTQPQAEMLRKKYAIYTPFNGRINVAGLNDENLPYVTRALLDVM